MNLKTLLEEDTSLDQYIFSYVKTKNDPLHAQRRQQQRAISNRMIQLCLKYGYKKWSKGALTFTINDKSLEGSPYEKHTHNLRGLRVISFIKPLYLSDLWFKCYFLTSNPTLLNYLFLVEGENKHYQIKTVYWAEKIIKARPRQKAA